MHQWDGASMSAADLVGQDENQLIARLDAEVWRLSAIFRLETKARLSIRFGYFVVVEFDLQKSIFAAEVRRFRYHAAGRGSRTNVGHDLFCVALNQSNEEKRGGNPEFHKRRKLT
jgi:hypothetical protein